MNTQNKYPNADTSPERLAAIRNFADEFFSNPLILSRLRREQKRKPYDLVVCAYDLLAMLRRRDKVIKHDEKVVVEMRQEIDVLKQQLHDQRWRRLSEEIPPKDGTWLQLYVEECKDHPLNDEGWSVTIGHNNFNHDGEDEWHIAGWCWTHDHMTEMNAPKITHWRPIPPLPKE